IPPRFSAGFARPHQPDLHQGDAARRVDRADPAEKRGGVAMEAVLFFLAAIGCVAGAIGVVAAHNPFHSVLALIVHLFSLAVLFLLLTSAFVAAAQVVVYAGAVMVLYVFVVAYVGEVQEAKWDPVPGQRVFRGLLASLPLVDTPPAIFPSGLKAPSSHGPHVPAGFGDPAAIGNLLLEKF